MFSWICPQCGKEVPPSKTDCPDCAERAKLAAAAGMPPGIAAGAPPPWQQQPPAGWQQPPQQPPPQQPPAPWQQPPAPWQPPQQAAAPPAPPAWEPPPPVPPPQQPQPQWQPTAAATYAPPEPQFAPQQPPYAPPPPQAQYAPPPPPPQYTPSVTHPQYAQQPPAAWPPPETRSAPPTWLVFAGSALLFLLLGAGLYYFMQRSDNPVSATATDKTGADTSGDASKQKVTNPLQKYVEVTGIRMITENKEPAVRFLVVNHSGAEIVDLEGNVTLMASTSRSDEDPVGTFNFKVASVGSNESKEMTAPLKTKLKPYELPDWQNATSEVQITSPQGQ